MKNGTFSQNQKAGPSKSYPLVHSEVVLVYKKAGLASSSAPRTFFQNMCSFFRASTEEKTFKTSTFCDQDACV